MSRENHQILIAGLPGSLRKGSFTRRAVEIALEGARQAGAQTSMLDLGDYDLKLNDLDHKIPPPNVVALRQDVKAAHGLIIGTPEYHSSFSGVLKHALDLMRFEEFEGKLVGLIGVAGGRLGAANSLSALRMVGRSLHAWVIPEQLSIAEAWQVFDRQGQLTDTNIQASLHKVGQQVARFAFLHNSEHAIEFMQRWEKAPDNPGGARG